MMLTISPLMTLGDAGNPAGFHAPDRICHEAFTEIFPRTAGISGKCEWTGGRSLQWSQYHQGL